ncbi:hypothetical protein [Prevotella melaninogenica]
MRKIILAVSIALLCAACGGDGSSSDSIPTPPSTQQNATEVTTDDIVKFLNLDKQQNVYQALETAKASLGNKMVNGKALNVTAVDVLNSDEEKGTFTLRVVGNSGGKTFTKDVEYTNFAQKPNDYEMVSRAVAAWKTDVNYLKDFDFDTLYRLKDSRKFTAAYLQKFINLSSSSVGGSKHYTFTPADWANTTVSDVRYVGGSTSGQIAFTITYKGRKNSSVGVEINKNEYYRNQISVNTEEVSKLYMRGVYEHADLLHTSLLNYDRDKFVTYPTGKQKNDGSNSMTLSIQLVAKDGHDTELANFNVELTGFKPLFALDKELLIANSTDVGKFFGKYFRSKADGDYSSAVKTFDPRVWFKKVQMSLMRDGENIDLYANEVQGDNGNSKLIAWIPGSGLAKYLDIYLLDPRIEVVSAQKTGNFLDIKYKLVYVNEVSVAGKEKTLHVHLLAP